GPLAELAHASPRIPIILTIAGLAALLPAIASVLWTREWGEVTALALLAMMIGFTLQNFLDPATSARISMRPFATEVRRHVEPSDRVFFFEETIPAVALYSRLDIPTLFDTSRTGAEPFFLIVPESLMEHLPERWREE